MAMKAVRWGLVLLPLFALGVGGAGARGLGTTTLLVQAIGDGKVAASGGQISCGQGSKSCYYSSTGSGSVILVATPSAGWTFDSWDSCPTPAGSTCTVSLDGLDHEVKATFTTGTAPGTSVLTVGAPVDSAGKGGEVRGGDIDCGSTGSDCEWDNITAGSTVTVVETPDPGYNFAGWGGACSGTAKSCTVAMDADHTVNASFLQSATTHPLTVTVTGNGTVTGGGIACTSAGGSGCSASEPAGSPVTLTATAGSGSGFTGWGGACAGSSTTCTVTMSAPKSVSAAFSSGTGSSFPLAVSVTGRGAVTGGGIDCGNGSTICTANEPASSAVVLTAKPASGATFGGWAGACSGTAATCAVTMNAARSVSATFSGAAAGHQLTVSVSGRGRIRGGGIDCGSGAKACSSSEKSGSSVTLTATPAAGAAFAGWGGACSGKTRTCALTMNAAKRVSARFSGTSAGTARPKLPSAVSLVAGGPPVVSRGEAGFQVTLRFKATRRGTAEVRALRAGRLVTALSFSVAAGRASIGPFPIAKAGFYTFEVTLAGETIRWTACLGRCGAGAPGGPFVLARGPATALRAGEGWSVTLHFRASSPAGAELRIYRASSLARDDRFVTRAGSLDAGPYVLSAGIYTFRLTATDAYGRTRTLTWFAVLL